jgi:protein-arginine kinase activator protein McsA
VYLNPKEMIYLIVTSKNSKQIEDYFRNFTDHELRLFIKDKTIQELNDLLELFLKKEKYEFCAVIRDRLEELYG